jgi:hypothetical protein
MIKQDTNIQVGFTTQEEVNKYADQNKDKLHQDVKSSDLSTLIQGAINTNKKIIFLNKIKVMGAFTLSAPSKDVDFDLGDAIFEDTLTLASTFQGNFSCGEGVFLDKSTSLNCNNSTFKKIFNCKDATFAKFDCGSAIFEDNFDCGSATFLQEFNTGTAKFTKLFQWRDASFKKGLDDLVIKGSGVFDQAEQQPSRIINIVAYMGEGIKQFDFTNALDMSKEQNEIVYIQTEDGKYIPRDVYLGRNSDFSLLTYSPKMLSNIIQDTCQITITSQNIINDNLENCVYFATTHQGKIHTASDLAKIITFAITHRPRHIKTLDIILNFSASATGAPLDTKTPSFIETFAKTFCNGNALFASSIVNVEGRAGQVNNEDDPMYYDAIAPFDFDEVIKNIKSNNNNNNNIPQTIIYKLFEGLLKDSYLIEDKDITKNRYETLITDGLLNFIGFTDAEKQIVNKNKLALTVILSDILLTNKVYCRKQSYKLAPIVIINSQAN